MDIHGCFSEQIAGQKPAESHALLNGSISTHARQSLSNEDITQDRNVLDVLQASLCQCEKEMERSMKELAESDKVLERSREALEKSKKELEIYNNELEESRKALEECNKALIESKSSLRESEASLKENKVALRENEEIFQSFMEYSPIFVSFTDDKQRSIRLSRNFEDMLGKPMSELIGKNMHELFPPELAKNIIDTDAEILRAGKGVTVEEELFGRLYSTIKFPIFIDGKPKYISGYTTDITESRQKELEIISAREEAEAANRAQSRFLATMSHEIRTPMNGMLGMLQLLELTQLTDEQQEFVRISKASADSLLVLINDVLDYSKIGAGKMELEKTTFSLTEMVNDVVDVFMLPAKKKGLILKSGMGMDIPDLLIGDPYRLRQILSNLVGNAVKFTKAGQIEILIRKVEIRMNREIILEFIVRDTGIGIPNDRMNALFQSFSQVDNSDTRKYGGTGLGLAISKSLVELMNGSIWAESKEGKGSSFFFNCVLEIVNPVKGDGKSLVAYTAEPRKETGLHLLLAEDDETCRMIVTKMASKKGWHVTVAENGKVAVDSFRAGHFDAVVMDIQMPVLNGIDATGIMRLLEARTNRHTPIIAMTAAALVGDRENCLDAGMDDYLPKPVDMNRFFDMIEFWCRPEMDESLPSGFA